jgi:3-deoxy-D-manno-octulosonic-acid transferase|tara:strand:- start:77 stop:1324 length:1248 start_codon:yes stop_codon:yes gene_type:complete
MLFIYRTFINISILISPIIILFRLIKKKEDPRRFKEKFCYLKKKKTNKKLIWFHGASVGEILSIIPLIKRIEKRKEIDKILVTSNTLSSSKIFFRLKLKKTIHQFFPIDSNYLSNKFLDHWKPSIAIFIDSEVWPNMIFNIKKKSIPLMLLNARITKKSFKRWLVFKSIAKKIFQQFDISLASNTNSKKYLEQLGAKKIKFIGNLKFSSTKTSEIYLNEKLINFFKSKKIWCAASTHKSEEIFCANVHKNLKRKYKDLITIIIPRHIDRVPSIINELEKLNLKIHLHGSRNQVNKNIDIYLVDSYGNTKPFYKISKAVFLGGSMIRHGGQNPIEPAIYGCKILYGPNFWNFDEIYKLLDDLNVSSRVKNINQTSHNIEKIFQKKNNTQKIKAKIKILGDKIVTSTIKEINLLIDK